MTKIKEDLKMQPRETANPLPQPSLNLKKKLLNVEITEELFDDLKAARKTYGITIREMVEWGIREYLIKNTNKNKTKEK